jgi:hypothetical protein
MGQVNLIIYQDVNPDAGDLRIAKQYRQRRFTLPKLIS